jgi:hypothetical protein
MSFAPHFLAGTLAAAVLFTLSADDTFQGNVVKAPFDASNHGQGHSKMASSQILYHGGPVMNVANSVYVIYYGTFPSTTQPIINDFLTGLSGSPEYAVNNTYNDPTSHQPMPIPISYTFSAPVSHATRNPSGSVYQDNYSQGTQLSNSEIPKIVTHAISAGLPADQNGVYLVATAPDVKISGFCNSFCAYHNTSATIYSGLHIRYALIPDPTQKCSGCNGGIAVYGDKVTPNNDMGADTMTDDIIHELSETVTDPDISAWYTQSGAENGDLCNYVYDTPTPSLVQTVTVNGETAHYNAVLHGRKFLIQLIWKNSGSGFCAAQ